MQLSTAYYIAQQPVRWPTTRSHWLYLPEKR